MQTLFSLWTWFAIGLCAITGCLLQVMLLPWTLLFDRRRRVAGRLFRQMGVLSAALTPVWRFGVHGKPPPLSGRPTVVVSNHESNVDPFLISHLPWEMKWLSKASLFKIPFLGWSMWLAGDVPLSRGDSDSSRQAMSACAKWLRRGMPVMIFPEGTRSKTADLLPFKDGAFRLAIEEKADVLPIAVSGTREALPKHSWRFGHRARAHVTVGQPISTAGMTPNDLPRLREEARAQIHALRQRLLSLDRGSPSPP